MYIYKITKTKSPFPPLRKGDFVIAKMKICSIDQLISKKVFFPSLNFHIPIFNFIRSNPQNRAFQRHNHQGCGISLLFKAHFFFLETTVPFLL